MDSVRKRKGLSVSLYLYEFVSVCVRSVYLAKAFYYYLNLCGADEKEKIQFDFRCLMVEQSLIGLLG